MTHQSMEDQRRHMLDDTEDYLNRHLADPQIQYPRIRRHTFPAAPASGSTASRLDVLIHGNFVLDLPICLNTNLADIHDALGNGDEKLRCDWKFGKACVGGFAAHAARAAYAAGHRVFLSTVIPLPLSKPFEDIFEEVDADTEHLVAVPGTTPASLHLQCNDGHLLVPRRGVQNLAGAQLPANAFDRFDAVLAQFSDPERRKEFTNMVAKRNEAADTKATIAVCGRGDWDESDVRQFKDSHCWLFFNKNETLGVARTTNPAGLTQLTAEDAVRTLGRQLGDVRLVTSLGADGALYLNGHAGIQRFGTRTVPGARPGAGDTLIAVTAVNSAAGVSDEESLRRGVAAATRYVVSA